MKLLKHVAVALVLIFHFEAQAQSNELKLFLQKFKLFTSTYQIKSQQPAPVPMPNPIDVSKTYTEDAATGLWHYPHLGKVYDPKTGYYLDFDPSARYQINPNAGKVYQGETEVEIKRQKTEKAK